MNVELRRVVRCKSCGASIIWAETSSGKAHPVNALPAPDGNAALFPGPGSGKLLVLFGKAVRGAAERFRSHFSTCPHAGEHRMTPRTKAAPR